MIKYFNFKKFSTVAQSTELLPKEVLLSEFKIAFPLLIQIDTKDKIISLINYNKAVATWYRGLRARLVTLKKMPQSFKDASFDPKDWDKMDAIRDELNKTNKEYSTKASSLATAYKTEMEKISATRVKFLKSVPIPLRIASISVNHLDISKHAELAIIDDSAKRSEKADSFVSDLQKDLITKFMKKEKIEFDFDLE